MMERESQAAHEGISGVEEQSQKRRCGAPSGCKSGGRLDVESWVFCDGRHLVGSQA